MKNRRKGAGRWLTAALAFLAVAVSGTAHAQVKLQYKFPEGQKLTYKTRSNSSQTLTLMGQAIETECVARPPRDVVVRARGIAAHADRPDLLAAGVVQPERSAEHVHASDELADQRVLRGAVLARIAARIPAAMILAR